MDQLSTVPGWTSVVFLVHENEIRAGQKRVYTHSYSTRGAGRQIELAMREKILNSMKIFLNVGKLIRFVTVKFILFVPLLAEFTEVNFSIFIQSDVGLGKGKSC